MLPMYQSSQIRSSARLAFEPSQIVCLDHNALCLYGEVVQIVESTQICWVRPLLLTQSTEYALRSLEVWQLAEQSVRDLRGSSDLLLPARLFRNALDTEVIPLMVELNQVDYSDAYQATNRRVINQLIKEVCLTYPEAFQAR